MGCELYIHKVIIKIDPTPYMLKFLWVSIDYEKSFKNIYFKIIVLNRKYKDSTERFCVCLTESLLM